MLEASVRRLTPLFALALAACAESVTAPTGAPNLARIHEAEDSHGGTPFMVSLVPVVAGDAGSGIALITLNSGQEQVCFKVTWSGLSAPVTNAHIHSVATTRVVVPFADVEPFPRQPAGEVAQCVFAPRELIKAIRKNPEAYYVNVHTTARPAGAISGLLTKTQGSTVNHG
jgi:hypothetical protein